MKFIIDEITNPDDADPEKWPAKKSAKIFCKDDLRKKSIQAAFGERCRYNRRDSNVDYY